MTVHTAAGWWDSLNWGTVPDWFVAGGTIAAFLIAAIAYAWNVSISRVQQARQVSLGNLHIRTYDPGNTVQVPVPSMIAAGTPIKLDPGVLAGEATGHSAVAKIVVHNGSSEVMGPVEVGFYDRATKAFLTEATYPISRIQAHSDFEASVAFRDTWHPGYPGLTLRIVFRDSAGRWWQRYENESVRRAPKRIRPRSEQQPTANSVARLRAHDEAEDTPAEGRWLKVGNGAYLSVTRKDAG